MIATAVAEGNRVFRAEPDVIPTTLTDAVAFLSRRRRESWDVNTTINRVHMYEADGKVSIPDLERNDERFVWPSAARQLAGWHGIPWAYVEKMADAGKSDLIARNFNGWGEGNSDPVLVRGIGDSVRGFLSDSYKVIWDLAAIEAAIDEMVKVAGSSDPGTFVFRNGVIGEKTTTLRMLLPAVSGAVKLNDVITAGIEFRSSETGHGAVSIRGFAERLICLNGAVYKSEEPMRIIHLGRSDDALALERVRTGVRLAFAGFNSFLSASKAATEQKVERPLDALKQVARKYEFQDDQMERLLVAFGAEPEATMFGVVQAVTRAAQGEDRYERRFEMERAGGDLVMVSPSEFVAKYDREFTETKRN